MTTRELLHTQFENEYSRLNAQQKQAVDTLQGPVMVIAGPGTGKTQILAARIGKILLNTDASPADILCLTYTDAGALAMRRRLLHFIGSDAYKVNIYTFHAFCNDIIQDNLSFFEKNELDPISDLEKMELMKRLIDGFPKNHPLKRYRGNPYYEIRSLESLFSTMKREGWNATFILECIDQYLADLPNRERFVYKRATKDFKKGDLKLNAIQAEKDAMERLAAAAKEFDAFQQLMHEQSRYDFDDMINWVIRAFENNNQLLLNYQERFQYILVDEYQDTSGTQNRLVNLLISYWDQPNIFVVGDDDQSIYRFQGANVENMEQFANTYAADLLKVVLTHNYRSTQPILDVSHSLISRNEERLVRKISGLTKDLVASHPEISLLKHPPTITEYETQRQEMIGITMAVENLVNQGIPPGNIAVIFRENRYLDELIQLFRLRNIPAYSKRSLNLLEIPLAKKILLILEYIAAEQDTPYGGDGMLFEILHFNFFGIPPIEIAKLSAEAAGKKAGESRMSVRQLLAEKSTLQPKDLFDTGIHPQLKQAGARLEELIADSVNLTLQGLLENTVRKAGVLATIMNSEDKIWQMQVLTGLFDFVKEETRRNPDLGLRELVDTIALMKNNNLRIPLVQVGGSEKGVNLLTAHGSKGLEFEYVFLAGSNASVWEKKRKPAAAYAFPDTLFLSQPTASEEEELRRLFYVALTRAQKYLYISYSAFTDTNKGLEPSKFIAEIRDRHEFSIEKAIVGADTEFLFQHIRLSQSSAPEIAQPEKEFINRMLDKFTMNVTALNHYLRCPLEFYFNNIVRIPSPKNEATEFGSSVHFALQRLFEKMKADPGEQFPSKAELLNDFLWYLQRHRESFTKESFARRHEYGLEILSNYYDEYLYGWNKVVAVERNIRTAVKGVPIRGKLDKLEFVNKDVNVVDYKTGDPDNARVKLKPPDEKNPNGGDYWRQAVFYKILVDNYDQKSWNVVSTEFDFVEPDKQKKYRKTKLVITPEDITTVTQQITGTWEKIKAHEFYTGCGSKDCHYCDFIKTNELYINLHDIQEEEPVQINES